MKFKQILIFIFLLTISGCSNNSQVVDSQDLSSQQFSSTSQIESNIQTLVNTCSALCHQDKEEYCQKERELIFENKDVTIGTCRSFAKFNLEFKKCEQFCKSYGHENGCSLKDGTKDINCDGN